MGTFICRALTLEDILFIKNSTSIFREQGNYILYIRPQNSTNIALIMSYDSKKFQSCSTSFIKVFQKNEKAYQSCSSKEAKPYMYNGNSQNLTVYVINTGFRLYINVTYDIEKSRTNIEFHYTQKEKNLCNESLIYCVKSSYGCDGKIDCNNAYVFDNTDEKNCMFPTLKYTIISVVTAFLCAINLIIKMKHTNSLTQNNMKRYEQDVYKRKDFVRLRKNKK